MSDQVDFLARLLGAWDFRILRGQEAVAGIQDADWQETVDVCRMLTSPLYNPLRSWHGPDPFPTLGYRRVIIEDDPDLTSV
jgi:hypothetical protein